MIARITGKLIELGFSHVVVDVGGVGYRIFIPMSTYDKLPDANKEVSLMTYTQVREDAFHLYGFATTEEKELFEILISVSGIGAKLALNILSTMPVATFCSAVANSELAIIKQINGVGKRTAERIVVELRDKVAKLSPGMTAQANQEIPDSKRVAAEEALLALEQLGFKRDKISTTLRLLVDKLPEADCSAENLIRQALQSLNS
jgi:holliday junction DNA helicase RuvA